MKVLSHNYTFFVAEIWRRLCSVENRLRILLPFVNWQAKRPVKPSISDALGRSKIRRTTRGISIAGTTLLVVPAEPFRINSGLNQSLFGYPHSNIAPASTSVLLPSPVTAQEPPLILPTVEATQPLYRVDHQNPSPRPPPEIMAPIIDNGDIRALLDSVNLLTQQVANMGQQITDRNPSDSLHPPVHLHLPVHHQPQLRVLLLTAELISESQRSQKTRDTKPQTIIKIYSLRF